MKILRWPVASSPITTRKELAIPSGRRWPLKKFPLVLNTAAQVGTQTTAESEHSVEGQWALDEGCVLWNSNCCVLRRVRMLLFSPGKPQVFAAIWVTLLSNDRKNYTLGIDPSKERWVQVFILGILLSPEHFLQLTPLSLTVDKGLRSVAVTEHELDTQPLTEHSVFHLLSLSVTPHLSAHAQQRLASSSTCFPSPHLLHRSSSPPSAPGSPGWLVTLLPPGEQEAHSSWEPGCRKAPSPHPNSILQDSLCFSQVPLASVYLLPFGGFILKQNAKLEFGGSELIDSGMKFNFSWQQVMIIYPDTQKPVKTCVLFLGYILCLRNVITLSLVGKVILRNFIGWKLLEMN